VVRAVVGLLAGVRPAGFYTEEVRDGTGRTGFRVVGVDGSAGRLASVGGQGGPRVGRYVVHVSEFEAVALPQLEIRPGLELVVIDEIGKMECLSPAFVAAARRALAAPVPLLATVALAGGGLIAEAKRAQGVDVVSVSLENRDVLPAQLTARLRPAATG
jgi:nucleoside-triphosphatase